MIPLGDKRLKDAIKAAGLLFFGLFTAMILYPLIHELGHFVIALFVGIRVERFALWPVPFVECEVTAASDVEQVLIGLGGIFIPYYTSVFLKFRCFWLWYVSLLLKGISIYAMLLSFIAVVLNLNGIFWENEDIVQVLQIFPNGAWLFLCIFGIMLAYGVHKMIGEKPLFRCCKYFGLTE